MLPSCVGSCLGIICNGPCMEGILGGVRDATASTIVEGVNQHIQPNLGECVGNSMKLLFKFLKTAFRSVFGLSHEIKTVEEKHLITIEGYLNSTKFNVGPEDREYRANVLYVRRCFRESIDSFQLLKQQRTRLNVECAHQASWGKIEKHLQLAVQQLQQRYYIASTVREMIEKLPAEKDLDDQSITKWQDNDPRIFHEANDEDLVGHGGPKSKLIELLDLEMPVHKKLGLVAVVGYGGVGKTTLVKKVYDERKDSFQMCAWVTVSQPYKPQDKLKDILKQFQELKEIPEEWENFDLVSMVEELENFISLNRNKRYIVVLDDVWDIELKNALHKALFSGELGSRILITTRDNKKVATPWKNKFSGDIFPLHPLSEVDAFLLLCKKLEKDDYDDVGKKKVLHQILKSCPLLPLIILALAGVLCQNPTLQYWNTVRDHLGREFKEGEEYENTKTILLYSYHDLHEELKSCFLYFGMFPEDHDIDVGQLIRIWIADGFINEKKGYTLEEVAQQHMDALVNRGLVMMSSVDRKLDIYDFHPINSKMFNMSAKVHDIFHLIITEELEKEHFSQVISDSDSSTINIDGKFERLSVCRHSDTIKFNFPPSNGRRCHSFRSVILNHSRTLDHLNGLPPSATSYVRVLYIERGEIHLEIPKKVGCLHNLRLLKLRICQIESFPGFISQLVNLETLDIDNTSPYKVITLPKDLTCLRNLRHLIISVFLKVPRGVLESLTQLHTLEQIDAGQPGLVQELKKLHHLRTLGVYSLKVADLSTFWQALMKMKELRSLKVVVTNDSETLDYNPINIPCSEEPFLPCLEKLQMQFLSNRITELNFGTENKFRNLQVLVIFVFELGSIEGELSSLERLYLCHISSNSPMIPSNHIRDKTERLNLMHG